MKDLDSVEEEIQPANNQPRESIIYGITREEYEKRIVSRICQAPPYIKRKLKDNKKGLSNGKTIK